MKILGLLVVFTGVLMSFDIITPVDIPKATLLGVCMIVGIELYKWKT